MRYVDFLYIPFSLACLVTDLNCVEIANVPSVIGNLPETANDRLGAIIQEYSNDKGLQFSTRPRLLGWADLGKEIMGCKYCVNQQFGFAGNSNSMLGRLLLISPNGRILFDFEPRVCPEELYHVSENNGGLLMLGGNRFSGNRRGISALYIKNGATMDEKWNEVDGKHRIQIIQLRNDVGKYIVVDDNVGAKSAVARIGVTNEGLYFTKINEKWSYDPEIHNKVFDLEPIELR